MYTVFFGLDILCLAYLVLQSKFVPRAIGVLLAIDGVAYLVYSFADLLAPGFAAHLVPWIQLPGPIAEGAFSLWLLVFGVNTKWWTTRAGAAAYSASVKQPNKLVIENGRFEPGKLIFHAALGSSPAVAASRTRSADQTDNLCRNSEGASQYSSKVQQ